MSTITAHVDLSKQDLVLRDFFISSLSFREGKEGKSDLIFVSFVGSKTFTATPNMLYFGDAQEYQRLLDLKANRQLVDIVLRPGDKNFTVELIQKTQMK